MDLIRKICIWLKQISPASTTSLICIHVCGTCSSDICVKAIQQCFLTSKGSASGTQGFCSAVGSQWEKLNCVRHVLPLDVFSRLLIGPKCIWDFAVRAEPQPRWGSLQRSPSCPSPRIPPHSQPSTLNFSPLSLRSPTPRHGFCEQSQLLRRVPLRWKVEKHHNTGYKALPTHTWAHLPTPPVYRRKGTHSLCAITFLR